jgi:hypothetical protein
MTTIRKDPLFRVVSYALVLGAIVSAASGHVLLAALLGVAAFGCLAVRLRRQQAGWCTAVVSKGVGCSLRGWSRLYMQPWQRSLASAF